MNESWEPASLNASEPNQLEEPRIDEIYSLVSAEFQVLDHYMENGILTFHVQTDKNSKETFLKLYRNLKSIGLLPILRREGEKEGHEGVPYPYRPGHGTPGSRSQLPGQGAGENP